MNRFTYAVRSCVSDVFLEDFREKIWKIIVGGEGEEKRKKKKKKGNADSVFYETRSKAFVKIKTVIRG